MAHDGDEQVLLSLSGTAWCQTTSKTIGIKLIIENEAITTAEIFTNGVSEHRTWHSVLQMFSFPFKINAETLVIDPVTITIEAMPDTSFDANDYITLAHF